MLKIAEKLKKVLSVFRSTDEELRIEEIQERLRNSGLEVPKTTLRTWLRVLDELGLIKIGFEIERGRGARVVAKYRPRILIDKDLIVGIPKDEIGSLAEKSGIEVLVYLATRSGHPKKEIISRIADKQIEELQKIDKELEEFLKN